MAQYKRKCQDVGAPERDWDGKAISSSSYTSEYENQESPKHAETRKEPKTTPRARNMGAMQEALADIRSGLRVLILMRGLPGAGKSTLARTILQNTIGYDEATATNHILSTDDYFMNNGVYNYDAINLTAAHGWNHQRANRAMSNGFSPVIIDNTNSAMWEMKPYATMATDYGYIVQIIEPCTDWSFNPKELYRHSTHQVPLQSIRNMLTRYEKNLTKIKLFAAYGLEYKRLMPPQYRNHPDLSVREPHVPPAPKTSKQSSVDDILFQTGESTALKAPVLKPMQQSVSLFDNLNAWGINESEVRSWDFVIPMEPTEPRLPVVPLENREEQKRVDMKDAATETQLEDFDVLRNVECEMMRKAIKVCETRNRDINPNYQPKPLGAVRKCRIEKGCQTEESHEGNIELLQHLFPNISSKAIRYWYTMFNGDFEWTVELFMGENEENINNIAEDSEKKPNDLAERPPLVHQISSGSESSSVSKKSSHKEKFGSCSEETEALKKMVESKLLIAPEHYSEDLQKVKYRSVSTPEQIERPWDSDEPEEASDDKSDEPAEIQDTMELLLGEQLVMQLEKAFGDPNFVLPQGFQPIVQMPVGFARQLFTFYMESLCQQMNAQDLVLEDMMKEDEEMARKMQLMEDLAIGHPCEPIEIPKIMKEQRQLSKLRKESKKWQEETPDSLALMLTKDKLFKMFPSLAKDDLLEILHAHGNNYRDTVETLIASTGSTVELDVTNAMQPPIEPELISDMWLAHNSCQQENAHTFEQQQEEEEEAEEEKWSPIEYRMKANELLAKRTELYEKANRHYQSRNYEVARFYSGLAAKQTQAFEHYNSMAATAFLEGHSRRLENFNMLDLHFLYVKEAIPHLDIFLDRLINLMRLGGKKGGETVQIITGRGKNSANGVAKIKPAVITRLKERGIWYTQLNPGLLKVRIKRSAKLTDEL